MDLLTIIFWVFLGLLFYTYVGYSIIASLFRVGTKPNSNAVTEHLPDVTIVIPEYNEASILAAKIENSLDINYPEDKLHIIVISDGSTDSSGEVLKDYPSIQFMKQDTRQGKAAALNKAMSIVDTPIVVFSDANSMLNKDCIRYMVSHFANDNTGAVAGEKKVLHTSGVGTAEGWYWIYESFMKRADAAFYTVVGATGELFAMRTALFKPIPEWIILDDLFLSLKVCLQGKRIAYEPRAFATEAPSATISDEKNRKVRIASGAFQLLGLFPLNNIFRIPKLGFQFFSRRWMRWVLSPIIVSLLYILNLLLAVYHPAAIYDWLLVLHIVFYLAAIIGLIMAKSNNAFSFFTIPFYFLFMNYCIIRGWFRYINHKETVLWKKAERTLVNHT